jgi:hypothetical protein
LKICLDILAALPEGNIEKGCPEGSTEVSLLEQVTAWLIFACGLSMARTAASPFRGYKLAIHLPL